jgi:hypothetical protein
LTLSYIEAASRLSNAGGGLWQSKGVAPPVSSGLCATCVHAQTITSDRGSIFVRCMLSDSDPRFAKYPRLPVTACAGWKDRY